LVSFDLSFESVFAGIQIVGGPRHDNVRQVGCVVGDHERRDLAADQSGQDLGEV
jgi:hypothetical protein